MLDNDEPNAGIAVPGEEAPAAPIDSGAPLADKDQGLDDESRARALGWAPKEEFKGDESRWVDAKTFVKRGEEHVPILRENVKRLAEKVTEFEREKASWQDQLRRIEATSQVALQRQREALVQSYEAAKRGAVANMDTATYDQLARDQHQAVQQFDQQVEQAPRQYTAPNAPPPATQAAVESWRRENTWFDADPALNYAAQAIHIDLSRNKPGLSIEENLRIVSDEVRKRFPEKFSWQQPQRQTQQIASSAVEGGERVPSNGQPRRKGAADLPAEARRAAQTFIKQGLFKDEADYARTYWSQQ